VKERKTVSSLKVFSAFQQKKQMLTNSRINIKVFVKHAATITSRIFRPTVASCAAKLLSSAVTKFDAALRSFLRAARSSFLRAIASKRCDFVDLQLVEVLCLCCRGGRWGIQHHLSDNYMNTSSHHHQSELNSYAHSCLQKNISASHLKSEMKLL